MDIEKNLTLIFLAGGKGLRLGSSIPKQFLPLKNKPIALHGLEKFLSLSSLQEIIIVCDPSYQTIFSPISPLIHFALPGKTRALSVLNGFNSIAKPSKWILIHDAARPFVEEKDIMNLIKEGMDTGAATLASPVTSTIKQVNEDLLVQSTLDRKHLWDIQTPQFLSRSLLEMGLDHMIKKRLTDITDDTSLAELLSHPVKIVPASPLNFKITTAKDLALAEHLV